MGSRFEKFSERRNMSKKAIGQKTISTRSVQKKLHTLLRFIRKTVKKSQQFLHPGARFFLPNPSQPDDDENHNDDDDWFFPANTG